MQIKTTNYPFTPTRMLSKQKLTRIPSADDKDSEKLNSHSLLMGMPSGTATLEDSCLVSYEIEHSLTVQSDSCTPIYLPKINENMSAQKLAD